MCWIPAVEKVYRGMSGFGKIFTQSSFYGSCQAKKVSGGWIPAVEKIYRGVSGFVKILPSPVSMGVAKLKRSLEDIPQLKSLDATAVPV